MSRISTVRWLKNKPAPAIAMIAALLTAAGGIAFAAQDRYTVKVPNGLATGKTRAVLLTGVC